MIYHIILLFLTLLIVVLTGCLYQNKSRKMLRFYDRMITFESFRKFYVLVLLLVLLVINFAQLIAVQVQMCRYTAPTFER
jgi:uncharacterized membrane protein YkvI